MGADQRVVELNLILPPPPVLPPGVSVPFDWVRVRGTASWSAAMAPWTAKAHLRGHSGASQRRYLSHRLRAQHERQRSPYWRPFSDR